MAEQKLIKDVRNKANKSELTWNSIQNKPTSMPANGGNSDTVNNKSVLSNVPANAKFTDTVYTHPNTHPASMITGLHNCATTGDAATVGGYNINQIKELIAANSGGKFVTYSNTVRSRLNLNNSISLSNNNVSKLNGNYYAIGKFYMPYSGEVKIKFNNAKYDLSAYPSSSGSSGRTFIGSCKLCVTTQSPEASYGNFSSYAVARDNSAFGAVVGGYSISYNDPYFYLIENNPSSIFFNQSYHSTQLGSTTPVKESYTETQDFYLQVKAGSYLILWCYLSNGPTSSTSLTTVGKLSLGSIDLCYDFI